MSLPNRRACSNWTIAARTQRDGTQVDQTGLHHLFSCVLGWRWLGSGRILLLRGGCRQAATAAAAADGRISHDTGRPHGCAWCSRCGREKIDSGWRLTPRVWPSRQDRFWRRWSGSPATRAGGACHEATWLHALVNTDWPKQTMERQGWKDGKELVELE